MLAQNKTFIFVSSNLEFMATKLLVFFCFYTTPSTDWAGMVKTTIHEWLGLWVLEIQNLILNHQASYWKQFSVLVEMTLKDQRTIFFSFHIHAYWRNSLTDMIIRTTKTNGNSNVFSTWLLLLFRMLCCLHFNIFFMKFILLPLPFPPWLLLP